MSPAELYRTMCDYARANGWEREGPGEGWWFHEYHSEAMLGTAVETQLHEDGIDLRKEPAAASVSTEVPAEPATEENRIAEARRFRTRTDNWTGPVPSSVSAGAGQEHPCPNGDRCALNNGAVHCFACGRNWPPDETWEKAGAGQVPADTIANVRELIAYLADEPRVTSQKYVDRARQVLAALAAVEAQETKT